MREIKFRAWDKQLGEFNSNFSIDQDGTVISGGIDVTKYFEVMQGTGLKDKNGVEIYEGDIVTGSYHADEDNPFVVIEYKNGGFYPISTANGQDGEADSIGGMRLEVIGNIYQNKELLK